MPSHTVQASRRRQLSSEPSREDVVAALESVAWNFAKSMPHISSLVHTTLEQEGQGAVRSCGDLHLRAWGQAEVRDRDLNVFRPRRVDLLDDGGVVARHDSDQQGEDCAIARPVLVGCQGAASEAPEGPKIARHPLFRGKQRRPQPNQRQHPRFGPHLMVQRSKARWLQHAPLQVWVRRGMRVKHHLCKCGDTPNGHGSRCPMVADRGEDAEQQFVPAQSGAQAAAPPRPNASSLRTLDAKYCMRATGRLLNL
jgi:hypothetical protein